MVQLHLLIHRVSYFRCLYNEKIQYPRAKRMEVFNYNTFKLTLRDSYCLFQEWYKRLSRMVRKENSWNVIVNLSRILIHIILIHLCVKTIILIQVVNMVLM